VPTGGSFVGLARIGKWERAVDGDANRTGIEQVPKFCELRAARLDLGCRDRYTQLLGLVGAEEAQGEYWKQSAAGLERAQKTTGGRAAYRVDDETDITDDLLGNSLGVVDEFVGAEVVQESLVFPDPTAITRAPFHLAICTAK
jgi:hypothetical protein